MPAMCWAGGIGKKYMEIEPIHKKPAILNKTKRVQAARCKVGRLFYCSFRCALRCRITNTAVIKKGKADSATLYLEPISPTKQTISSKMPMQAMPT